MTAASFLLTERSYVQRFLFQTTVRALTFCSLKSRLSRLKKTLSDARIGLESTGHYSINIANFLLQKRLCLKIFNPLHVSLMRKASTLRKTKTDKSDSKFLANLMFSDHSKPYSPPLYQISEWKQLTRSRRLCQHFIGKFPFYFPLFSPTAMPAGMLFFQRSVLHLAAACACWLHPDMDFPSCVAW